MKLARLLFVAAFLAAMPALVVPGAAQTLTITGRIVDAETGAPVAARVEIPDRGTSVVADGDGRFAVDAGPAGSVTLVVS